MSVFNTFFSSILATIRTDEKNAVLPILAKAASSIAANPTEANVLAQGNLAFAMIVATQPAIGQDVLKEIATDLGQLASQVVTPPAASK